MASRRDRDEPAKRLPRVLIARRQHAALTTPILEPTHARWLLPVRHAALALGFAFLTAFAVALHGARRREPRGV